MARLDSFLRLVVEQGAFGDHTYSRTLTLEEEATEVAAQAEQLVPLRAAALAAHAAWFGLKAAA